MVKLNPDLFHRFNVPQYIIRSLWGRCSIKSYWQVLFEETPEIIVIFEAYLRLVRQGLDEGLKNA